MLVAGLRYGPQTQEHWDKKPGLTDFYDSKADVERLVGSAGLPMHFKSLTHPALHPGRTSAVYLDNDCIGWVGEIHPSVMQALDLGDGPAVSVFEIRLNFLLRKQIPTYRQISRYPSIRRDLALVVDQAVTWAQFKACLLSAAPVYLSEVRLFDVYTGKGVISGRKSFAIGLILQEISRTLTDTEIESAIGRILQTLNQNLGATLRE
jgi:phenylalanyl-tRNA synthetase beta chain